MLYPGAVPASQPVSGQTVRFTGGVKMTKASKAMRFFFFNAASLILIGIWLTGFDKVHWFLYAVPVFFLFAAAVGICPGLIIAQKIFGKD